MVTKPWECTRRMTSLEEKQEQSDAKYQPGLSYLNRQQSILGVNQS